MQAENCADSAIQGERPTRPRLAPLTNAAQLQFLFQLPQRRRNSRLHLLTNDLGRVLKSAVLSQSRLIQTKFWLLRGDFLVSARGAHVMAEPANASLGSDESASGKF